MSVQKITGSNNLGQALNVVNNNADEQIVSASYSNGNIVLTKYNNGTINVSLPIPVEGGDVLTYSGSITLGTASGSYNLVSISPLTYIYNSVKYDIITPTGLTLSNGDPSLDRLDSIYIDINDNTIKVDNGTAANPPQIDTLPSTNILIGVIYVKAGATPTTANLYSLIYSIFPFQQIQTQINNGTPISNLIDLHDVDLSLLSDEQVLTYDAGSSKWIPTDKFSPVPTISVAGSGLTNSGETMSLGGDLTMDTSIDINGYDFTLVNGTYSIMDLTNYTLSDFQGSVSYNFATRTQFDTNGRQSINSNTRLLYGPTSSSISLDFGNRTLNGTLSQTVVSWQDGTLRAYYTPTYSNDLITKAYFEQNSAGLPILPGQEILFGTGTGSTTSNTFKYDKTNRNITKGCSNTMAFNDNSILGNCNMVGLSSNTNILGSNNYASQFGDKVNIIGDNNFSNGACKSIISGNNNRISYSNCSTTIGGNSNSIYSSSLSNIIGGQCNIVCNNENIILGGSFNNNGPGGSCNNIIINGTGSNICNGSNNNTMISTFGSRIENGATSDIIIGGTGSVISSGSNNNIMLTAFNNTIDSGSCNNLIAKNDRSCITQGSHNNIMIGGTGSITRFASYNNSTINSFRADIHSSCKSNILGGDVNGITASMISSIIGSECSKICSSNYSSILGGRVNTINGGVINNITGSKNSSLCNNTNYSSIFGGNCNNIIGGQILTIVGGSRNTNMYNNFSAIVGGYFNKTCYSSTSFIGGGYYNCMYSSAKSAMIGGGCNRILDYSYYSTINAGCDNIICASNYSGIIGGQSSIIYNSSTSVILGGNTNILNNSVGDSGILAGCRNTIGTASSFSSIIGGNNNLITNNKSNSSIISSKESCLSGSYGQLNTIINGFGSNIISPNIFSNNNIIIGQNSTINNAADSVLMSNGSLIATASSNVIIGGISNTLYSSACSSILGSSNASILSSSYSVILGGNGLSLNNESEIVLVPNFRISGSMSTDVSGPLVYGFTGTHSVAGHTFTIVNGLVISIAP